MNLPVPADSIQLYLSDVNRYPLLSPKEELVIAKRYYRDRDIEDAHRLVTSNLRYVVKIAFEFRKYGCRMADLIQEGNIGLMVAVKKFNPHKGFRFITYATWWIKSYIQDFIIKTAGLVKRSPRALKKRLFYKTSALKETGGLSEEAVISEYSLNNPIGEEGTTHQDILRDENAGAEDLVERAETSAIVKKEVSGALKLLNDRERVVVRDRIMSEEPASLQSIGERLGVTRERVRQIEGTALKKLGKTLSSNPDVIKTLSD